MNIITSGIVQSIYDSFWNDLDENTRSLPPKPVLVIARHEDRANPDAAAQLGKMLGACKLQADIYNIIYLAPGQAVAWHRLNDALQPGFVFLVGIAPAQLGISALFRLNEPNRYAEKIWLPTLSVMELDQHADVKKQLWSTGMKPIFVDQAYGAIVA